MDPRCAGVTGCGGTKTVVQRVDSKLRPTIPDRRAFSYAECVVAWRDGKTTAARGYGAPWRRARKAYLFAHPLCVICQAQGRVSAASVVDHIRPHRGDQVLFWDRDNWQALCTTCHNSIKQAAEHGHARMAIGLDGWPVDWAGAVESPPPKRP